MPTYSSFGRNDPPVPSITGARSRSPNAMLASSERRSWCTRSGVPVVPVVENVSAFLARRASERKSSGCRADQFAVEHRKPFQVRGAPDLPRIDPLAREQLPVVGHGLGRVGDRAADGRVATSFDLLAWEEGNASLAAQVRGDHDAAVGALEG